MGIPEIGVLRIRLSWRPEEVSDERDRLSIARPSCAPAFVRHPEYEIS